MNKIVKATVSMTFLSLLVVVYYGWRGIGNVVDGNASGIYIFRNGSQAPGFNAHGKRHSGIVERKHRSLRFLSSHNNKSHNKLFQNCVIVPTSIVVGRYNLTATTSGATSVTQSDQYAVPNLTGATGDTGATGTTGDNGSDRSNRCNRNHRSNWSDR